MAALRDEARNLRSLWSGFFASRVLLTANNFRIFDHLNAPTTANAVASALKTDARATEILLDALTGLGLIRKRASRYSNAAAADRFLRSDSPYYQGDIMRHADNLWENWSGLDTVIRTGSPHHKAHNHEAFIKGMHNLAVLKARKVIQSIGLRGVKQALDLGGGPGTYAIEMARRGVSAIVFDRPETIEIAKKIVKKSGVTNVGFIQGDFHNDPIGNGYDLIFISQVLHSCSAEEVPRIIDKSRKALSRTGRIVVQEFFIRDDRTHPVQSALFSINMLVNTAGGRCYSPSEIKRWLHGAGFGDVRDKMMDDTVLVLGRNR